MLMLIQFKVVNYVFAPVWNNDGCAYIRMTVGHTFNFKGDYYEWWHFHLTFIYSYILQLSFFYDSVSIFLPCRESAHWRKWPNEEDITQHIYPKWTFGRGWCKWSCMHTCPKKSVLVLLNRRQLSEQYKTLIWVCPFPNGLRKVLWPCRFHL